MNRPINHSPHAKRKRSLPILIALSGLALISFLVPVRPNKERLVARMTDCLREERFEQLYEEAGDNVHLNVSKEKFVRRMRAAAAKLKAIDPELKFQQDPVVERWIAGDEKILLMAARKLERDGKSVSVIIQWNLEGEFVNISASPDGATPEEFTVHGVSYKHLTFRGRIVEE
ncbi:MAG: hypothetical protein ABW208_01540 [Pyrinomonadaceae bacterium]